MFCKSCGKEIDDNANFCNYCGAKVNNAENTGEYSYAQNNEQPGSNDYYYTNNGANYGQDFNFGYNQNPNSTGLKSKFAAGLLAIFLGEFGIHNFYLGYNKKGLVQLLCSLLLCWTIVVPIGIWVWCIIEAVQIFSGSVLDANGNPLSD